MTKGFIGAQEWQYKKPVDARYRCSETHQTKRSIVFSILDRALNTRFLHTVPYIKTSIVMNAYSPTVFSWIWSPNDSVAIQRDTSASCYSQEPEVLCHLALGQRFRSSEKICLCKLQQVGKLQQQFRFSILGLSVRRSQNVK